MKTLVKISATAAILISSFITGFASGVYTMSENSVRTASETGDIKGYVKDENNKPIAYANVFVIGVGAGASTEDDGSFTIHGINPGTYDVKASYIRKISETTTGVVIRPNQTVYMEFKLYSIKDSGVIITDHFIPFFEPPVYISTSVFNSISKEQNEEFGTISITDKILNVCSSCGETGDHRLVMRGSRPGTVQMIVDGERLSGIEQVPNLSIENVTVLSGGIPAEYGDLTGGVIIVTTKNYISAARESNFMQHTIIANKEEEDAKAKKKR